MYKPANKEIKKNNTRTGFFVFGFLDFPVFPKGFTLLETIVALAIIMTAMAGPVTLATRGIFSAKFAKSRLMSANLAQEGIELVRKIRDDNVLAERAWDFGIGAGNWQSDVLSSSLSPFTGSVMLRDPDTGIYNHSSGVATPFSRRIAISKPDPDRMEIISEVTWSEAGLPRVMIVRGVLYNWR